MTSLPGRVVVRPAQRTHGHLSLFDGCRFILNTGPGVEPAPGGRSTTGDWHGIRACGLGATSSAERPVRTIDHVPPRIGYRPLRFSLRLLHGREHDLPAQAGPVDA